MTEWLVSNKGSSFEASPIGGTIEADISPLKSILSGMKSCLFLFRSSLAFTLFRYILKRMSFCFALKRWLSLDPLRAVLIGFPLLSRSEPS